MSMYNMLFGMNPLSDVILATLGLVKEDCGRFRDCFITEGKIAIYTRLGGGNRECWCENITERGHNCYQKYIQRLQSLPNYLYDRDDDFDSTYATFYYSFPEKYKELLSKLETSKIDPDERWAAKLKEIEIMDTKEIKEKYPSVVQLLDAVMEKLNAS